MNRFPKCRQGDSVVFTKELDWHQCYVDHAVSGSHSPHCFHTKWLYHFRHPLLYLNCPTIHVLNPQKVLRSLHWLSRLSSLSMFHNHSVSAVPAFPTVTPLASYKAIHPNYNSNIHHLPQSACSSNIHHASISSSEDGGRDSVSLQIKWISNVFSICTLSCDFRYEFVK